jgi:hypothetical protein
LLVRSRRNGWCCMHRHRFSGALSSVSGEDKSPLNITTGRTHEGAVLVARDRHGVVLRYVHQVHLCAARKTTHRAYSIKRRSSGCCDDGVKQVQGGLSTACPPTTRQSPEAVVSVPQLASRLTRSLRRQPRDAGPTPRLVIGHSRLRWPLDLAS